MLEIFKPTIKSVFNAHIITCDRAGGGASGVVYKLVIDKAPFEIAIKTGKNAELLSKECEYIRYIRNLVDIKLPKIYHEVYTDEINYVVMQYFDGVNCSDKYVLNAPKKVRLSVAEQIADNIIKLQNVSGNKFGELSSPQYNSWQDYYRPFAKMVKDEAKKLLKQNLIGRNTYDMISIGMLHFDDIFSQPINISSPIHGDYWAQNIMVDKSYKLIGVVDPFNCMWGDSEYELFALNAIYGKKLPVLEAFLKKVKVTEKFFLKNSFYILFSETYWVVKLHHNNNSYLNRLSKQFKKQLKLFNLI